MVAFDAMFSIFFLDPDVNLPTDRSSKKPITDVKERIEFLIETLEGSREKILIPTPCIGELLVLAGKAGPDYLAELSSSSNFEFADFDLKAAIEFAASVGGAIVSGDKRRGANKTWAKAKFDEQIVAIAKARGAHTIYSDDKDVVKLGQIVGIRVVRLEDLPKRPEKQTELDFSPTSDEPAEPE